MKAIFSMFIGPSGKVSSRRVNSIFLTFVAAVLWAVLSYKKGEMIQPPEWIVAWALGSGALVAYQPKGKEQQ